MKKAAFLLVLFIIMGALRAYAHPPSDIIISYDPQTKILQAVIMHDVNDPVKHFIRKIDVSLNSKEIISQEISRQDNNLSQTVSYLVPDAKRGDTFSVEGYCNISGKLKKVLEDK